MGIINQGILGGFSGKVGPIVGFHWKSKYYIRARAAKVSNPRTPRQQEQRGKFATASSFLKTMKPFIRTPTIPIGILVHNTRMGICCQ